MDYCEQQRFTNTNEDNNINYLVENNIKNIYNKRRKKCAKK